MTTRVGILFVAGAVGVPAPQMAAEQMRKDLRQVLPDILFARSSSVSSDRHLVAEVLRRWCDEEEMDLVITVGGTFPAPGPSSDEIVPEATVQVLDRSLPGLSEAMRSYAVVDAPLAALDRGVAGIRSRTLILNLPDDPELISLFLEGVGEVLEPVLERLRAPGEGPVERDANETPSETGLDAGEFAAFVQRRRGFDRD